MTEYFDKNGTKIEAGMKIACGQNIELVHPCSTDGDEIDDLGINATNWDSPAAMKVGMTFYSLSDIDIEDWEIVKGDQ